LPLPFRRLPLPIGTIWSSSPSTISVGIELLIDFREIRLGERLDAVEGGFLALFDDAR